MRKRYWDMVLVICSVDRSILAVDPIKLSVKETIPLSDYTE